MKSDIIDNIGFYTAGFIGGLGLLFYGFLLLTSPNRFLRFGAWVGRLMRLNPPANIEVPERFALQWRLTGVIAIITGVLVLYLFIEKAL